jgi:hypothetical protein
LPVHATSRLPNLPGLSPLPLWSRTRTTRWSQAPSNRRPPGAIVVVRTRQAARSI